MKKLVTAACALAAGLALADGTPGVVSGNTVGYSEVTARENLTFYAPQFRGIGVSTIDINSIQLDDDGVGNVGWGDTMYILGPLGNETAIYSYWDAIMGATNINYWSVDDGASVAIISLDPGVGIAIDNPNGNEFNVKNSGEVSTNTVEVASSENLNWCGNPFPESISIQAIQLDDDGIGNVGWGDTMYFLGPLGNETAIYSYWDAIMGASASNYWSADDGTTVADVTLTAGAGFAIDNPNGNDFTIKIACPFTL